MAKTAPKKSENQARSSVRFPVHLPMSVKANSSEHKAETCDMSASGLRFSTDVDMAVGSVIEFTISIPGSVIGAPGDVCMRGAGRVVRCSPQDGKKAVAAIIDEYHLQRR